MKKILFLGGLGCGGAENQMSVIASLLSNTHNVHFIYTGEEEYCASMLKNSQVNLIKLTIPRLYVLLRLSRIYILLKVLSFAQKEKIETIISFLDIWNFTASAVSALTRKRIKAIIGIRNARQEIYTSLNGEINTFFNKYTHAVVSNSHNGIDIYKKYLQHSDINFVTIYNIIKPLSVTSKYDVRYLGKLSVCIPASYREVKNPYRLIEAVHKLSPHELSNLQISWYGRISSADSNVYNKMIEMLDQYQLHECFKVYDATENIADIMNASDFVALFSTSEGLPNSICEAMSLAKPVIMSKVSDYNELVDDDSTGYICDPYDITDIANVLRKCISLDKDKIISMGKAAKSKAEHLFSTSSVIEKWENLL